METAALFPTARQRSRIFGGLTEQQEHIFTWIAVVVVLLYATGWVGAIKDAIQQQREMPPSVAATTPAPTPTRQIASELLEPSAPTAAYINDAMLGFLNPLRGASGKVRFTTITAGAPIVKGAPSGAEAVLRAGGSQEISPDFTAPDQPGVYNLAVQIDQAMRQIDNLSVITLVPFSEKRAGISGSVSGFHSR